jgi:3-methylcrotonyl-CoA carboxylase alpha subunit
MLGSVLIANRGEIARRIIRTCRRMGVRTVAVYSDADAQALHVKEADAAVRLGPAPAAESYLLADRIIAAARETGAEAIHPGYGFLSENAAFAEGVIKSGLIWIGPPPAAIRAMALKDAAKALMQEAGVPVTPGYLGEDQDDGRLAQEAGAIGYPVLIKAVAGGGGKGMRKVDEAAAFEAALVSCRREALTSFGDDRVLIEKYVQRPRHIEVQVFADRHDAVVHLFERDCSVQRRHQKVIEEAPAPGITDEVRAFICGAAVRAAQAVGYEGAGTVEFIADGSEGLRADRIWFMEMNTRLQVEHPVTEAVTGLDLVEWQLCVASGEPLPLRQDQITLTGHAMEARLYAEAPEAGFLPSVGPLSRFFIPPSVRVDTGVAEGGEITAYYDPMIAKLIAAGPTRRDAAHSLAAACRGVEVWPVKTNAAFLARVLTQEDFLASGVDTDFIAGHADILTAQAEPSDAVLQAAAHERLGASVIGDRPDPWRRLAGFRLNAAPQVTIPLQLGDRVYSVVLDRHTQAAPAMTIAGATIVFDAGQAYGFKPPRIDDDLAGATAGGGVISPMPGQVIEVLARPGDAVTKGQTLAVIGAMKMEHAVTAPRDAVVTDVLVRQHDQVTEGQILMHLEQKD